MPNFNVYQHANLIGTVRADGVSQAMARAVAKFRTGPASLEVKYLKHDVMRHTHVEGKVDASENRVQVTIQKQLGWVPDPKVLKSLEGIVAQSQARIDRGDAASQYFKEHIMYEQDEVKAYKAGTLVGRVLKFSIADGYALYQITKVTERSATVRHLAIGDAYRNVAVPDNGPIPLKLAKSLIEGQDRIHALFGNR